MKRLEERLPACSALTRRRNTRAGVFWYRISLHDKTGVTPPPPHIPSVATSLVEMILWLIFSCRVKLAQESGNEIALFCPNPPLDVKLTPVNVLFSHPKINSIFSTFLLLGG